MRFYNGQHRRYCRIDLHVKTLSICILDRAGQVLVHHNVKANPEALVETIALYRGNWRSFPQSVYLHIACDTLNSPSVWHYVVQQKGPRDIISWDQAPTEISALAAAKKQLSSLNKKAAKRK